MEAGRVLPKCLLRDYSPVDRHLGLVPDPECGRIPPSCYHVNPNDKNKITTILELNFMQV